MAAFYGVSNELKIRRGLLFHGNRIIPPAMLRKEVFRCAHEGHPRIKRTKAALRSHFWWPGMDHAMADFVKNCGECAWNSKVQPIKNSRDDAAIPKPVQPAKQWGLDIA